LFRRITHRDELTEAISYFGPIEYRPVHGRAVLAPARMKINEQRLARGARSLEGRQQFLLRSNW
jgi:hypothetical protein